MAEDHISVCGAGLISSICQFNPTTFAFQCTHPSSVRAHKSLLGKKMLRRDKWQLPFRGTCNKAALVPDVPRICSGSRLWLGAALHHTWSRWRQCWTRYFFQYACSEQCFSFQFFSQLNGLHKVSVNLMVHKSTFQENKCSPPLHMKSSCSGGAQASYAELNGKAL